MLKLVGFPFVLGYFFVGSVPSEEMVRVRILRRAATLDLDLSLQRCFFAINMVMLPKKEYM